MKQDYEKPELIVYEDLSNVTMGIPSSMGGVVKSNRLSKGVITMKQDYEKPELIVYEDLSDITKGDSASKTTM
jgi:hypothetical protein